LSTIALQNFKPSAISKEGVSGKTMDWILVSFLALTAVLMAKIYLIFR